MEKLSEINLMAIIEGQDYEKSLQKIVSILFFISTIIFIISCSRNLNETLTTMWFSIYNILLNFTLLH